MTWWSARRCIAAVRRGELDRLTLPLKPLDVLAQQIVAESAAREWDETGLWELLRGAWSFRDLTRAEFDEVLRMLAQGYTTRRGRHGALIYHDGVNHLVQGPQERAPDGAHLRRHDSRHRRLPGDPRAAGAVRRHGQRGLRGREPAGGRVPARQRLLSHPARRAGAHPRRGRARAAALDPVLARGGAGAQRRALRECRAAARRARAAPRSGPRGGDRVAGGG